MEGEIEQLVNMGFPADLAAQALATAAGNLLTATDWPLDHHNHHHPPPVHPSQSPPSSTPTSSIIQPKINRFFHLHPPKNIINHNPQKTHQQYEHTDPAEPPLLPLHPNKRHKSAPRAPHAPLSERMRPRGLDEVVGQDHLLPRTRHLSSFILWGPPGTGKTSIANVIISSCQPSSYRFISLSAVRCGVKDIQNNVDEARKTKLETDKPTLLFLDEIHRFNKAQQNAFLPAVQCGSVILIGATTENPSFHLIPPLLSRCRVLTLDPLKPHHVAMLVNRAVIGSDRGLAASVNGIVKFQVNDDATDYLSLHCDGDARVALNALEFAAISIASRTKESNSIVAIITVNDVKEALKCKHLAYDRAGEEHYNLISALIKSMRGSDPDAAIYWLARMVEGGEKPLYIARRLIIFASEDVGLGDPKALTRAVSCYQACRFLGMDECSVILAECVAYLALACKSVYASRAIGSARKEVMKEASRLK